MSATTFNTLQYAKQLRAADMPEQQVEVAADALGIEQMFNEVL